MKSAGEEADLQFTSTDPLALLAVVRAVASLRLWWESCAGPDCLCFVFLSLLFHVFKIFKSLSNLLPYHLENGHIK